MNTVNGLFGNVTLAPGTNISISPSGQTLTVTATGGPGGFLPSGTSGQTLRHSGSAWVANNALTSDGTNVTLNGNLALQSTTRFTQSGLPSRPQRRPEQHILWPGRGNFSIGGGFNTAIGESALRNDTSGGNNVAAGFGALNANTTGWREHGDRRSGADEQISSGSNNTAGGYHALLSHKLRRRQYGLRMERARRQHDGINNTAVGINALPNNVSGIRNTAVGESTLATTTTARQHGRGIGGLRRLRRRRQYGAWAGGAHQHNERGRTTRPSGQVRGRNSRVGTTTSTSRTAAPRPSRARFASGAPRRRDLHRGNLQHRVGVRPVLWSIPQGKLGTVFSSARFKEQIRDMGDVKQRVAEAAPGDFSL